MILLLPLLFQASTPATPIVTPPPPSSWSILNVPTCPGSSSTEIVVCGGNNSVEQRLPLPDEGPPQDRPRQPTGDPRAALDNAGRSCPPGGCTGVDLLTVPVVLIRGVGTLIDRHSCCENGEGHDPMALIRDIGRKFRKKPDTSNRVPILLDDPAK